MASGKALSPSSPAFSWAGISPAAVAARAAGNYRKMKEVLVLSLLAAIAWFSYDTYKFLTAPDMTSTDHSSASPTLAPATVIQAAENFHCDGRTHCSQTRSCAEAKHFL